MKRRFIEYDLPLAEISEESAREKNIRHGHPSTLHIWWARRPLAASRATAFAALIDDPGEEHPEKREEIRKLIQEIAPWEAVKDGNSRAILRAREMLAEQYGRPPKVLDPFAGGGSIPLETLRLGCETYASDYNPVAVFIEKATLEWPQRFGIEVELPRAFVEEGSEVSAGQLELTEQEGDTVKVNLLAFMVQRWATRILEEARAEIGRFYPTERGEGLVGGTKGAGKEGWTPVGYLWARTIPCQNPSCGAEIPLIRQYWLAKKKTKRLAYRPVVDADARQLDLEMLEGPALKEAMNKGFDPGEGSVSRANASCPVCGQVTRASQVRRLARGGRMGERLVAVVLHHPDETGKRYRLATDQDEQVFREAEAHLEKKVAEWPYLESALPEEELPPVGTLGFRVNNYGITQWMDLFNVRQQLALVTFTEKIRGSAEDVRAECQRLRQTVSLDDPFDARELAGAVIGSLTVISGNMLDLLNTQCAWEPIAEAIRHLFGRQAIPMTWDFGEANPLGTASGSFALCTNRYCKVIASRAFRMPAASMALADATHLSHGPESFDAVLTDPPYYDNVPYAALSDFFYVWFKRMAGESFPELFATPLVPKDGEAVMEPERHKDRESAKRFFETALSASFQETERVLKPGGIAVVVYAHKTTTGWETMLNALLGAGFVVTGSWPLHTEAKHRLRAVQSAALASSIYMVCRKAERAPVGFWNDIQPKVKARVEEKLEQFWEAGLVRGGDFFISAIGPGMEHYSRYDRVETYDGEEVSVLELLHYIRKVATDFLVHRLLSDATAEAIDKEAQFYLTYRWTFLDTTVEFDDARRIAAAGGVDLGKLWEDGGFVRKRGASISVVGPEKRGAVKEVQNMVDGMHCACQLWQAGKRDEVSALLAEHGWADSSAFWQLCQAIAECLLEGSKEKQVLEGLLLGRDEYARGAVEGPEQAELDIEV